MAASRLSSSIASGVGRIGCGGRPPRGAVCAGSSSSADARVVIAGLDRAIERLPIEQIDIGERRLQQHIGQLALRSLARRAVDHAGVHQDLENIDAAFAEVAIGADIAADHEARRVALHDIDRQVVDGGAIDQHAVVVKHRRHDAGNGDRGAQRLSQSTLSDARARGRW